MRCVVDGCERPRAERRRMCWTHADRMKKTGTTDAPPPRWAPYGERLMSRVKKTEGCWEWMGNPDRGGYGKANYGDGRRGGAHRAVYTYLVGPIPDGLQLDHLCRNPICVNPDHLEPVTQIENRRRSEPCQRTHCPQGHPYEGHNLLVYNGGRRCRTCREEKTRERRRLKRLAASEANS